MKARKWLGDHGAGGAPTIVARALPERIAAALRAGGGKP